MSADQPINAGDRVENTRSHRTGRIVEVREDGTVLVQPDTALTEGGEKAAIVWSASFVTIIPAEPAAPDDGRGEVVMF